MKTPSSTSNLQLSISHFQFLQNVLSADCAQVCFYLAAFFGLVPEEEHALLLLLLWCLCREDGLERVGIVACCPAGGSHGERRGREVLHLFQMEVQLFRLYSEVGHVEGGAGRMAADEVGDELLAKSCPATCIVEDALELSEEAERRLAHDVEYSIARMFGSHFEASADVLRDEFAGVFFCSSVEGFVFPVVQEHIVSDTAADEAFLDAGQRIDTPIDVEQRPVVAVQVRADGRMDA